MFRDRRVVSFPMDSALTLGVCDHVQVAMFQDEIPILCRLVRC